ncbi:MAG: AmmeMemoRadiSam system radical SAM enzyme [Spirochaetota bacterium]
MKRRTFDHLEDTSAARCLLCPHACIIRDGGRGICNVRGAEDGHIVTYNYGEISSMAVDPIEKKPLYHFHPGEEILSLGSIGCNLRCPFCQNHRISQEPFPKTEYLSVDDLVRTATPPTRMVAFTYAEPVVWYEYVYDAAQALHVRGIKTVLVTNGYINEGPLLKLLPFIDAMNIDLKGDDAFYANTAKGNADDVRRTIALAAKRCHVEVTTLIVTALNDSITVIDGIASFLASIRPTIPLHLSAYHPSYRYAETATGDAVLLSMARRAKEHLHYVYIGNTRVGNNNTYCPKCGNAVIERTGYLTDVSGLRDGCCVHCGEDQRPYFVL